MPVFLFEQEELLHAAVDIGPRIVPGICGVVLIRIRPGVCQVAAQAMSTALFFSGTGVLRYGRRDTHTSPDSGLMFPNA
jgi:hypothetical protein